MSQRMDTPSTTYLIWKNLTSDTPMDAEDATHLLHELATAAHLRGWKSGYHQALYDDWMKAGQPTHAYPGHSKHRAEEGVPGHCERCCQYGHVKAHRDLGCGDVGCTKGHDA